jgi:anti-sigma factor RsiW
MAPTPCPDPRLLRQLLNGALSVAETEPLAQHLEGCAACAARVQELPVVSP